jgi:hypothetical protein
VGGQYCTRRGAAGGYLFFSGALMIYTLTDNLYRSFPATQSKIHSETIGTMFKTYWSAAGVVAI